MSKEERKMTVDRIIKLERELDDWKIYIYEPSRAETIRKELDVLYKKLPEL